MNPINLARSVLRAARKEGLGAAYAFLHERAAVNWIERPLGISTESHIPAAGMGRFNGTCLGYVPATYRHLRIAFEMAELGPNDVLLDYGSGLGRVIIEAARLYPLRRAVGVEFSSDLVSESRRNIAIAQPCCPIEISQGDAATFAVPADVTVAFFANPFHGPVLDAVFKRLRTLPRLRLIALAPRQGGGPLIAQFHSCPWLKPIKSRHLIGNAGGWTCSVFTVAER